MAFGKDAVGVVEFTRQLVESNPRPLSYDSVINDLQVVNMVREKMSIAIDQANKTDQLPVVRLADFVAVVEEMTKATIALAASLAVVYKETGRPVDFGQTSSQPPLTSTVLFPSADIKPLVN